MVTVRSPQAAALAESLARSGAQITTGGEGQLQISGLSLQEVGAVAFRQGYELHELSLMRGSLESAYNQLTRDTVEFSSESAGKVMSK